MSAPFNFGVRMNFPEAGVIKRGDGRIGKNCELAIDGPIGGKPIIAIHGMWATYRRWTNFGNFFSERGFRFLAPTLPRHYRGNERDTELGRLGVMDYVDAVADLICSLRRQGIVLSNERPIIFGHSMGGPIALKLAERGLASNLVLMNSAPPGGISLHADIPYQLAIARYLPKLLMKKPFKPNLNIASRFIMNGIDPQYHKELHRTMVAESGRAAWQIRCGDIEVDFQKITCPVLIFGAENDRITPPQIALDISKKLLSDRHHYYIWPKFAHWLQAEPGWEAPAQRIFDWLQEK
jgi:pimeloyl-ACP methyl ester carboxylesterase